MTVRAAAVQTARLAEDQPPDPLAAGDFFGDLPQGGAVDQILTRMK